MPKFYLMPRTKYSGDVDWVHAVVIEAESAERAAQMFLQQQGVLDTQGALFQHVGSLWVFTYRLIDPDIYRELIITDLEMAPILPPQGIEPSSVLHVDVTMGDDHIERVHSHDGHTVERFVSNMWLVQLSSGKYLTIMYHIESGSDENDNSVLESGSEGIDKRDHLGATPF
jgi:hypothetical protein